MAQELLDDPQVRAALEQVRGGAVSQTVGPEVRGVGQMSQQRVHHFAHLAGIHPVTSSSEEEGRATLRRGHPTADREPRLQGPARRDPEGHHALFRALAGHSDQVG